ncbi:MULTISPECIES: hypothetical protein [Acidithrix]|uniref:ATPase n=1 Tax=Acidithrix ferrooxidans TaxID=1280514 RepID=A0A0D8HDC4_9ACTN|nr:MULTISPECIES: hypothetical protein [Acidithrix]KJF15950.1 hypothetical protein AXFE_31990 [Acidithrix ferrooxidans]CAG4904346.1 unnamed protein product [Acidithrix sp. C25]
MTRFDQDPERQDVALSGILDRMEEIVSSAKAMPLSASVLVSRDEMLYLISLAKDRFPAEMREAQWIIKEKAEYLDRVSLEAQEIMDQARNRAEAMVSKQEVVRQAQASANRIVMMAREDAARLRFDAEDYADQKLAEFEIALSRVMKAIKAGREKLAHTMAPVDPLPLEVEVGFGEGEIPFDQDLS